LNSANSRSFINVLPFVTHISQTSFFVSLSKVFTRKAAPHRLTPIESDEIIQRIGGIQSLKVFLYPAQHNQVTKHQMQPKHRYANLFQSVCNCGSEIKSGDPVWLGASRTMWAHSSITVQLPTTVASTEEPKYNISTSANTTLTS